MSLTDSTALIAAKDIAWESCAVDRVRWKTLSRFLTVSDSSGPDSWPGTANDAFRAPQTSTTPCTHCRKLPISAVTHVSAVVVVAEKDGAPGEVLRPDHVVMSPEVLNSALIASSAFQRATAVLRDHDWLKKFVIFGRGIYLNIRYLGAIFYTR